LYLNAALMVLEILRRMGWGVLRLENEQLRNTQVRRTGSAKAITEEGMLLVAREVPSLSGMNKL
jgi:hypothetical protein